MKKIKNNILYCTVHESIAWSEQAKALFRPILQQRLIGKLQQGLHYITDYSTHINADASCIKLTPTCYHTQNRFCPTHLALSSILRRHAPSSTQTHALNTHSTIP